ncbi:MAG: pitrilysin family protein [bacterium]
MNKNSFPMCVIHELPSGMKIITEEVSAVRSAAVGIVTATGSGYETPKEAGISHFIEHMIFKGTPTRSAFQIAQEIDSVGGKINAFTSKEYTCYYTVMLDQHVDTAVNILSDIFLNSVFDPKEIELEKGVILEEIKMYEDTPDELIHDFFAETIWSGHPMGSPTIGYNSTVKAISQQEIKDYQKRLYTPDNVFIVTSGNVDHGKIADQFSSAFAKFAGSKNKPELGVPEFTPKSRLKYKKTEQAHICLGTKGVSHMDPKRYTYAILDNVLGGSMSSRLFQEVREKRGLAYAIYSYNSSLRNFGAYAVYAGISRPNLHAVIDIILKELGKVKKKGITKDELKRAKEQLKGNLVLGLETTSSRMNWIAKSQLYYGRVLTVDETIEKIEAVSMDDIISLANEFFIDKYLNLTVIGDLKEEDIPKTLSC